MRAAATCPFRTLPEEAWLSPADDIVTAGTAEANPVMPGLSPNVAVPSVEDIAPAARSRCRAHKGSAATADNLYFADNYAIRPCRCLCTWAGWRANRETRHTEESSFLDPPVPLQPEPQGE